MSNVRINLVSDPFPPRELNDPNASFACARKFMKDWDFKNAICHLKNAVKLAPKDVTFNLALSLNLFCLGKISESRLSFDNTIALDEQHKNTAKYENVIGFKQKLFGSPHNYLPDFLQGSHAPERQVFMSAAINILYPSETRIKIIEIGSFGGASLLTWTKAAEKFLTTECDIICIDPWGESGTELYNAERMGVTLKSNIAYEVFCHNATFSGEGIHITPMRGSSQEILPNLGSNKYDLIFVDGSHHYSNVLNDIKESTRLLKLGGIICGDDLELQLEQCDQQFIRKNKKIDFIKDPRSGIEYHPGVTLAVGEYFGNVACFSGFWAMRLTKNGYEKISFKKAKGLRPNHWPSEYQNIITAYFQQSDELGELL